MSNDNFQPNWASAPGDTIADILRERNISEDEFAHSIEYTNEEVKNLLEGRTTITLATARHLEEVLGASVEFWMARDFQYWQDIAKFNVTDEQWVNEFPLDDMIKFGWIQPVFSLEDKVDACLRFFDVPSIRAWSETYAGIMQQVAFKKSEAFESRPASVAAWLRQSEIEASRIDCRSWDAKKFEESLSKIRALTREKNPAKFIPELMKHCAESGVAIVIVRTPRGCPASGATKFLSKDKALLILSFRHLTDDHFWFAFFHEAGHLLLHGYKDLFLEDVDSTSTIEEEEANEFAENILVPAEFKPELLRIRNNAREVIRFALKLGVSPGIIVGQLHHFGIIPYNQLSRLQRRYKWGD
jgi:Zn-dependent peptidase ImmA (M78 family)/plasmid maintenance system antidote protein VapI